MTLKLHALVFSLVAACGGAATPASSPTPKPTTAASDPACPVAVAGTSVTVEDASTGAALVFVTTGDIADVRRRAAAMAEMHNKHHGAMGPLPDGAAAGGEHAGHDMSGHAGHDRSGHSKDAGGMIGVHSKATASDVDSGVKVTFTANGADVAKLQSELRMHAQHFATGTCAMGKSS